MNGLTYTSESLLADKNNVLDLTFLGPIGKELGELKKGILSNNNIDNKIISWWNIHKVMYTYSDKYNKKTLKQEKSIKEISNKKDSNDIMNLVEISIGRLLEYYFRKTMDNVRVRKTTDGDDYFGHIDYIVEFKGKDGKINSAVGIDLTVLDSLNEYEKEKRLFEKKRIKTSKPKDYVEYLKGTNKGKINKIPRLVLHMDKDLAYFFTNNYFADIQQYGKILTDEQIQKNLDYAIDDYNDSNLIKKSINTEKIDKNIFSLIDEYKKSVNNLINK